MNLIQHWRSNTEHLNVLGELNHMTLPDEEQRCLTTF
jgi:hypothetical protein